MEVGPEQACLHETDKGCVRVCLGKGGSWLTQRVLLRGWWEICLGKGSVSLPVEAVSHALVCYMLTRRTLVTDCLVLGMKHGLCPVDSGTQERPVRREAHG